jgi:hypothetical protein
MGQGVTNLPAERERRRDKRGKAKVTLSKGTVDLLTGVDRVEDWDDEELRRGQKRAIDGTFKGRPPALVPQKAHRELLKRRLAEAQQLLADSLPAAVETLKAIMESPFANDRDRIKAAELIIERTMGKAIERIEVGLTGDPPWMEALKAGIVDVEEDDAIEAKSWEVADDEIIFEDD